MFVSQPEIPVPLAVEFPFPAWATRLSECATPPADADHGRRRSRPGPSSTGCPTMAADDDSDDAGIDPAPPF